MGHSDQEQETVGTQPAAFEIDYAEDSSSTLRPMSTQAIFRPEVDVDSESTDSATSTITPPPSRGSYPQPSARRRAGRDPAGARDRSARRADDRIPLSPNRSDSAGTAGARSAARPAEGEAKCEGYCPHCGSAVFVPAATRPRRHGGRPVRDQGLHRPRRARLGVPGRRPQRQRAAGGAQGPGALRGRRSAGDRDGRAAVPGRGGAPVDREDLQLRRAPRLARGAGRLHRDGVRRRHVAETGQRREAPGRRRPSPTCSRSCPRWATCTRSAWRTTTSSPRTSWSPRSSSS